MVAAIAACAVSAVVKPQAPAVADDQDDSPSEVLDDREAALLGISSGLWPHVQAWVERKGTEAPLNALQQTALSLAVEKGSVYIVRALLERAADPNACDKHEISVLSYAARQGHVPVTRALLDARASIDRADIFGNAPLHGAVGFGHPSVTRVLLAARSSPELRTGDVTAPESYGAQTLHEPPLHIACRMKPPHLELRSPGLVRMLLHHGANPCAQDDRGDTPAHLLVRKGDAATLWLLLSRSAPALAEHAAHGARNALGLTSVEEASEASLVVKLALRCGPIAARVRQHLDLPVGDGVGEDGVDEAAEEETWRIYREHMERNPSVLPFEEGGDGVRRRAR